MDTKGAGRGLQGGHAFSGLVAGHQHGERLQVAQLGHPGHQIRHEQHPQCGGAGYSHVSRHVRAHAQQARPGGFDLSA